MDAFRGPFALRNKGNSVGDPGKRDCFDLRRHRLLLFFSSGVVVSLCCGVAGAVVLFIGAAVVA